MKSAVAFGLSRLPNGGAPAVPVPNDSRWAGLLKLVASEYPYCTMFGVHVVDGCVVSCEGVQRSFLFDAGDAAAQAVEPAFDAHWKALEALCVKLGSGRLAELRFSRGRPMNARTSEGGRRFKRLLTKSAGDSPHPSPMN